jgi:hypothetical protein
MSTADEPGRGYHDIGGLDYGAVDPVATDMKPWERLSTAISNALGGAGRNYYVTDETRRTREQMGEPLYSDLDYYERSTQSMKMILVEKDYFTEVELEARMKIIEKRMAEARG